MTIREQLLEAMKTAAMGAPLLGGRVYRSRVTALSREESPGLIIRPSDESISLYDDVSERDLSVHVIVVVRDEAPDTVADQVIEQVQALFFADPLFGDLASGFYEAGTQWNFADADNGACELTVTYRVKLHTPVGRLSPLF